MGNEQDREELKQILFNNTSGSVSKADIDKIFEALPKAYGEWLTNGAVEDGFRGECYDNLIFRMRRSEAQESGTNVEHYKVYVKPHQGLLDVLTDMFGILCVCG